MFTPTDARQLGNTTRIGLMVLVLVAACLMVTIGLPHKVSAQGLLPNLASIELPLGDTPLEPVLTPVTNTTNEILPVDINPGGDSIGAAIAPDSRVPLIGGSDKPIVSVNVPVQPVVQNVTQPIRQVLAPQPNITPPNQIDDKPAQSVRTASASKPSNDQSSDTYTGMKSPEDLPFYVTAGSTMLGMLPQDLQSIVRNLGGRPDFTVSLISLAVFIAVMAMIVNILYMSGRGGFMWSGNGLLAKISQRYDLAQLSVLAVALAGAGIVMVLTLIARP